MVLLDVQLLREIAAALIRNGGRFLRNCLVDDFHRDLRVAFWVACRRSSCSTAKDVELDGIDLYLLLFDGTFCILCQARMLRQRCVLLSLRLGMARLLDHLSSHLTFLGRLLRAEDLRVCLREHLIWFVLVDGVEMLRWLLHLLWNPLSFFSFLFLVTPAATLQLARLVLAHASLAFCLDPFQLSVILFVTR